MQVAIEEAHAAAAAGEVPIGALVVHDGKILARSGNRTIRDCDPTAHAEIIVIRQAARSPPQLPLGRHDSLRHSGTLQHVCWGHDPGAHPSVGLRCRRSQGRRRPFLFRNPHKRHSQSSSGSHPRRSRGRVRLYPAILLRGPSLNPRAEPRTLINRSRERRRRAGLAICSHIAQHR